MQLLKNKILTKKPLKIAIIADALDYQYAGIYYYTKEILKALAKIDSFNEYFIVRSISEGDISKNVKELIIPQAKFPGAAPYRLFVQIPRILAKQQVDIIVEPRHFGPFNLPKSIKRATFIHDLTPLHHPEWHQFTSRFLQKLFLPSILKRTDHVLTNSEYTKQDIIRHFPVTKHKITCTLLAKEAFFKPQKDLNRLKSLGIIKPYILHVGTIEPRKNLNLLIEAYNQLKQDPNEQIELVLVGKQGWKSESVFKAIDNSPHKKDIKVLGYVERKALIALYSSAEAFVYPSLFEGFGLPLVEAMACGCPIISSNAACLPEIADKAGLYFSPTSSKELLTQLQTLRSAPSKKVSLKQAALQQAAKFSWEKTCLLYTSPSPRDRG